MKRIFGILLILIAIIGGLYVGGWLFFFKAIVDIIQAIQLGWIAIDIAIGLCKIFIGIPTVEFCAFFLVMLGIAIFCDN